jgi:hypothetical protein
LLALNLREFAEIPIPPEKVEGVIDQFVLSPRGEFGLEFREIRAALMDDDDPPSMIA